VTSKKSNPALHVTIAIASAFLCAGAARATCLEAWPPDMKTRPDFTCVPLTDRLLVSLEGATKAEVIKAMKANGRPLGINEQNVLHFVSTAPDSCCGGDVNFEIENDKVVRIFGSMDGARMTEFIWNPAYHGAAPNPCSDLPGSHYARCNK
jgi:hypothetical protein